MVFRTDDGAEEIPVFTTRPDTLFGDLLRARPEHPAVGRLVEGGPRRRPCARTRPPRRARPPPSAATSTRPRTGVFTGRHVVNPVNGEALPVWVADYVLMDYGTGALMAVPAHDERDLAFARAHGLPVRRVIAPEGRGGRAGRRGVRRRGGW